MCQLTVDLDDEILTKAEAVAVTQNMTVTALVRHYLESLASRAADRTSEPTARLRATFAEFSRDMGERRWTRESLYER